ncbi:hypothetical protein HPB47_023012 [Ixodes persulcatus]|uniref:Uncharacterized protein n=1 Tax=Ixodes persulcatus TaxID=34615 RepID=A0AC60Q8Z6_IXOPE|nr:hypothetical protein HPB47_023012 [Ixodes persulcatus]
MAVPRMTKASFDELLGLVHDRLVHAPTHRSPISPAERLAITLRFLASPGSLGHVAISYRMHKATLSGILQEALPAIWDCLSPCEVAKILEYAEIRLRRTSVERLVTLLAPQLQVPRRRPAINVTEQTLIFLWRLAYQECFRSFGDRFELSKSTVCRVVHRVGLAVLTHGPNFVSWPTEKEALHNKSGFEAKAGFPGVSGAIDRSHIVCKGLQGKDAQSYINRHGLHRAGDPGSVHDARMYRSSELPTVLTADNFPFDSHLLGDDTYPLRQSLLVPYRNYGRLTEQNRRYNTKARNKWL